MREIQASRLAFAALREDGSAPLTHDLFVCLLFLWLGGGWGERVDSEVDVGGGGGGLGWGLQSSPTRRRDGAFQGTPRSSGLDHTP